MEKTAGNREKTPLDMKTKKLNAITLRGILALLRFTPYNSAYFIYHSGTNGRIGGLYGVETGKCSAEEIFKCFDRSLHGYCIRK
jgi:hypothetical protein